MINSIEQFTAAIQLITAVNFTFILTHLPKLVCKHILMHDISCRKKFRLFTAKRLSLAENNVKNMRVGMIGGVDMASHKNKLQQKIDNIKRNWKMCEEKAISTINRIYTVKGFKCLFLFISVYCVFDMVAIPTLKLIENDYLITLISLINIFAIIYSLRISWIILLSKWDKLIDSDCYKQTTWFLIFTFIGIIPVWILAHIVNWHTEYDIIGIIKYIWDFDIWSCLFLPFYPCLFSLLYIGGALAYVATRRFIQKCKIVFRIWIVDWRIKKLDKAYKTLTNVGWR